MLHFLGLLIFLAMSWSLMREIHPWTTKSIFHFPAPRRVANVVCARPGGAWLRVCLGLERKRRVIACAEERAHPRGKEAGGGQVRLGLARRLPKQVSIHTKSGAKQCVRQGDPWGDPQGILGGSWPFARDPSFFPCVQTQEMPHAGWGILSAHLPLV